MEEKKEYSVEELTTDANRATSPVDGLKASYLGHDWYDPDGSSTQITQYARVQDAQGRDCVVSVSTSWTYNSSVGETPDSLFFSESAERYFCEYSPDMGNDVTPGQVFALARMYWGGVKEFPNCFHLDRYVVEEDKNLKWEERA